MGGKGFLNDINNALFSSTIGIRNQIYNVLMLNAKSSVGAFLQDLACLSRGFNRDGKKGFG